MVIAEGVTNLIRKKEQQMTVPERLEALRKRMEERRRLMFM